jgi:hypothetical protein
MGLPPTFEGGALASMAKRRPVADVGSAVVNASLGHGRRQALGSIGSHGSGAASTSGVVSELSVAPLETGTAESDGEPALLAQAPRTSVAAIQRA